MMKISYYLIIVWTLYFISNQVIFSLKWVLPIELNEAITRVVNFSSTLLGRELDDEDFNQFNIGSNFEEVNLTIEELLSRNGFAVERYQVITEDGYMLTMFRIPSSGQPIFLLHGLMMSADDWVTPGPESGIAYLLAAEGFDVWLGNVRGNKHSRQHVRLSVDSPEFWDFSWDEMGRYDLPAMIDFVLNVTRHPQLIYVGHSQGTTSFFVMGSEKPEYSKKVSLMIGLASASAIPNLKSPFLIFIKYVTLMRSEILFSTLRKVGFNDLRPIVKIMKIIAEVFCIHSDIVCTVCSNLAFLVGGIEYSHLNMTTLSVLLSHSSAGASLKQIEHYAQTVTFNRFLKFDYGSKKNFILYGSKHSPNYNVRLINTPIAMFYSGDDWLASERDMRILRNKLNNVVDFYKVPIENFTHLDFLYSKDTKKLILPRILNLIKKFLI